MTNFVGKLMGPFIKTIKLMTHNNSFIIANTLFLEHIVRVIEHARNLLARFGLVTFCCGKTVVNLLHERLQQAGNIMK